MVNLLMVVVSAICGGVRSVCSVRMMNGLCMKMVLLAMVLGYSNMSMAANWYAKLQVSLVDASGNVIQTLDIKNNVGDYFSVSANNSGRNIFSTDTNDLFYYYTSGSSTSRGNATLALKKNSINLSGITYDSPYWGGNVSGTSNSVSARFESNSDNVKTYVLYYKAKSTTYYATLLARLTDPASEVSGVSFTGSPAISLKDGKYSFSVNGSTSASYNNQVTAPQNIDVNGDQYLFSSWGTGASATTNVQKTLSFTNNSTTAPTYTAYYRPNFTKYYATLKAKTTDNIDVTSLVTFTGDCTKDGTSTTYVKKLGYVTSDLTQNVQIQAEEKITVDGGEYKFDRWSDGNTNIYRSVSFVKQSPGNELTALYKPNFAVFSAKLTADTKDGEDITNKVTFTVQRYGANVPKDANNIYSFKSANDGEASQNSITIYGVSVPQTINNGSDEYVFKYWSDGNTKASRDINFTKDGSTNLQAIYAKMCTLTIRTVSTCQGKRISPSSGVEGTLLDGSAVTPVKVDEGKTYLTRYGWTDYEAYHVDYQFKGECGQSIIIKVPNSFVVTIPGNVYTYTTHFSFSSWSDGSGIAQTSRTMIFDNQVHSVSYNYTSVDNVGLGIAQMIFNNVLNSLCQDDPDHYVFVGAVVAPNSSVGTVEGGNYNYVKGTNVTVVAIPQNECYEFDEWLKYEGEISEGMLSQLEQGILVDGVTTTGIKNSKIELKNVQNDALYIAKFIIKQFEVTSSSDSHGNVTIKQDDKVVASGSNVDCGSTVVYEATSTDPCYEFDQWSDGRTLNPRPFTVRDNINISASFKPKKFTINTSVKNGQSYMGDVLIYDVTDDVLITDGKVTCGHEIRLSTSMKLCGSFVQWGDGNKDNPRTFIASKDESFEVEFSQNFSIYVTVQGSGSVLIRDCSGNVSTGKESYQSGASLNCNTCYSVTAMANGCSNFIRWIGDLPDGQDEDDAMLVYSSLSTSKNLVAVFEDYQENLNLDFEGEDAEIDVCIGEDIPELVFKSKDAVIAFSVTGKTDGLNIVKSIYDKNHDVGYAPCSSTGVFVSAQANVYDKKLYITLDTKAFPGFESSNVAYYHFTVYDENGQIFDDWGSNVGPGTQGPFPSHRNDFDFTKTYTLFAEIYNNEQGKVYTEEVKCESQFTWAGGYQTQTENGSTLTISGTPTKLGDIKFDMIAVVDGCSSTERQSKTVIIHVNPTPEIVCEEDHSFLQETGAVSIPLKEKNGMNCSWSTETDGFAFTNNILTGTVTPGSTQNVKVKANSAEGNCPSEECEMNITVIKQVEECHTNP